MQRRVLPAVLAGFAALGLAACQQEPQRTVVVVPSQACDTSFRVVNNSGLTVERLYFSHSSLGAWGADQLGTSVLPPGRFVNYRANNAGNYDFRVVWTNGQAAELRGVNICRASQITVTNRGLVAT
ncbi:hypothetical protein [Falsiroseomonas oryzae]|uniref:hypothetical protein n=1 Tax=Falsiroseomonas oryzae TaxID=2766473 RepID=UPI0022EB735A|nr:hypothetical protein [Roseomonas sp. MO-31]